jgi:hypothetical protein
MNGKNEFCQIRALFGMRKGAEGENDRKENKKAGPV